VLKAPTSVATQAIAACAVLVTAAGCSSSDGSPTRGTAGGVGRPADACTMLSSDQVASAVGTPGPYNGSHEDPGADGNPVWGCAWGTSDSSADIREMTAARFAALPGLTDFTTKPITGIGDKALLATMNPDGRNPSVWFAARGHYYVVSVEVSRSELGAGNAPRENTAEQTLARILAAQL